MSDLGNKEIFAKNLNRYMFENNKTRNDLARDLGVAYTTITDWVQGNKYPRIDKIEKLANYFGVSKAHLVEDLSSPTDRGAADALLLKQFHQLTPANQVVLQSTLAALLASQDKQ